MLAVVPASRGLLVRRVEVNPESGTQRLCPGTSLRVDNCVYCDSSLDRNQSKAGDVWPGQGLSTDRIEHYEERG